jgi:hypothetical protein
MDIRPLPAGTILLVEVGSTAHGTGLPGGEDNDELAVVVEDPEMVLGLHEVGLATVMPRTQPEGSRSGPGDTDRTLHSLRRFIRLAASGNPSIMMALWAPEIFATDEGRELQSLGELFVGRHVIPRYRGYMQSLGPTTTRAPWWSPRTPRGRTTRGAHRELRLRHEVCNALRPAGLSGS